MLHFKVTTHPEEAMATQVDNLKEKPEIKAGYDNEYMRMFVKQFASNLLEIHSQQLAEQVEGSQQQENLL
jgi:hypothetical protein